MKLRDYQVQALQALWQWFRVNPTGAPVIVLPTGAGKSHVIAAAAKAVCEKGPDRRVLILAHRKELLEQTAEKIRSSWPAADLGVYSAGLARKDVGHRVTVAGVQSAWREPAAFGQQTLVLVDEVHLVNVENAGMYRMLLGALADQNPALRLAGLTATPFRTSSGVITQGDGLFTDIAYEARVLDLVRRGFLAPVTSKLPAQQADLSAVTVRAGEFVLREMEQAFDRPGLTAAAVNELIRYGEGRKSWLVFCAGVRHVEHVTDELTRRGVAAGAVTGETPPILREQVLRDFKNRRLRCLVNCDILSVGFDHPGVDLIGLLRATRSPGLYMQIVGRGLRTAPGKENCHVVDLGGNALRFGPIDKIRVSRRRNPLTGRIEAEVETARCRVCPACGSVVLIGEEDCEECGHVFLERGAELEDRASEAPILSTDPALRERHTVLGVDYRRHEREGKVPSLRVDYAVSRFGERRSEWVCIEHGGYPGQRAYLWWKERSTRPDAPPPRTVDEALRRTDELKTPTHVTVERDGKYWKVVGVGYEEAIIDGKP